MKKVQVKSNFISSFENELSKDRQLALSNFGETLQNFGTPLIEEIEGNTKESLVTFIYSGEADTKNVLIQGGFLPDLEDENINECTMNRIAETNYWSISYIIDNALKFLYYFFPNDSLKADGHERWDNVQLDKLNDKTINLQADLTKENLLYSYCIMPNASDLFEVNKEHISDFGELHNEEIYSNLLEQNIKLSIYTPYGYDYEHRPYKVLLLNDGEDYLNLLKVNNTLDKLVEDNKITPVVVVFIHSTENRAELYSCNDLYSTFITDELLNHIYTGYNVSRAQEDVSIGGISLGGLSAIYTALRDTKRFSSVLLQSGSFWYKPDNTDDDSWITTLINEYTKDLTKVYMTLGVLESDLLMIKPTMLLKDELQKKTNVEFEMFNSGHDYLSWGETLHNGLISLFGGNSFT